THTSWNYRFGVNKVNRSVCVQMLGRDDRSDFWFVLQDRSIDPRVPGFSLDDFQGPRFSHQLPISADFKVTIHEVSIRAVFGIGSVGESDRNPRIQPSQLSKRPVHLVWMISQPPVELLMQEARQQLIFGSGETHIQRQQGERMIGSIPIENHASREEVLAKIVLR